MQEKEVETAAKDEVFTIIVNGREKKWMEKKISFRQAVELAYGSFEDNPNISYTVTYSDGPRPKSEGRLVDGQSVKVKDGMIFNVKRTDKS